VKQSGLDGRGGAAFPTCFKWEGAANAPASPKYVVVNADESEPGTFKDRILMERDPNRIIEGAILAAYAIGAARRSSFAARSGAKASRLPHRCREAGYLGVNILGSGRSMSRCAAAREAAARTALFESIARSSARSPLFLTTHGWFGKPTAINNVETWRIPAIVTMGRRAADWHRRSTAETCVSGDVKRPAYTKRLRRDDRRPLDDLAGGAGGG
jgi:NADH-quinone oxidoreductase subunit F